MTHKDITLPCNISICGSTQSGKTYLTKKILKEQLLSQVDALIILSPTLDLSGDWDEFQENDDMSKGKLIKKFSNKSEFEGIINEILQQNESLIKNFSKKDAPDVLIILDDCVGLSLMRPNKLLDNLSTRSRHLKVSIMVLAQKITAIPRIFRLNCKYFHVFQMTQFSELERFLEELCSKSIRKQVREHINQIYNQAYNYILVQCFENKVRERMYLNGETNIYDMMNSNHSNKEDDKSKLHNKNGNSRDDVVL